MILYPALAPAKAEHICGSNVLSETPVGLQIGSQNHILAPHCLGWGPGQFTSPLSFFNCKMGLITAPASQDYGDGGMCEDFQGA